MTDKEKFRRIAMYDKRLLDLEGNILKHVALHKNDEIYCANAYWYGYIQPFDLSGGFKGELTKLVGWESKNRELKTSEAYDICYRYLYNLLGDCRHEGLC